MIKTVFFIFLSITYCFSQSSWQAVIDNFGNRINGKPVMTLFNTKNELWLGSKTNRLQNNSGSWCCPFTMYTWNSSVLNDLDCSPVNSNLYQDSALILCGTHAYDSSSNSSFTAIAGKFSEQYCFDPWEYSYNWNIVFHLDNTLAYYMDDMRCSDTVYSVAALTDNDNPCVVGPDMKFRTYVGARCALCSC